MATIDSEQAAITRRQKIAEMMMEQGQQPIETNNVAGGYVVPVSPMAGISKVIQQMSGAYLGKKADEQQTALHDKKLSELASLDLNAPDLPNQLKSRGMITEALAAQKDSTKVHREGIPAGFNATDSGGIAPMPMPGGSDYSKFLLEQAGAKAQIPSYGEPQKLQIAQQDQVLQNQAAVRDAERLQMAKEEANRRAIEASKPKPPSEFQQFILDQKQSALDVKKQEKISGQQDFNDLLDAAEVHYKSLDEQGAITNPDKSLIHNIAAGASSSIVGQAIGNKMMTKAQSERNSLLAARPLISQAVMKATGMTSKQLDSNVELQNFMKALGDPSKDIKSNLEQIGVLRHQFGGGNKDNISVDIKHPENMTPEDKKALEADITKEKAKQKVLKFDANGNMVQ